MFWYCYLHVFWSLCIIFSQYFHQTRSRSGGNNGKPYISDSVYLSRIEIGPQTEDYAIYLPASQLFVKHLRQLDYHHPHFAWFSSQDYYVFLSSKSFPIQQFVFPNCLLAWQRVTKPSPVTVVQLSCFLLSFLVHLNFVSWLPCPMIVMLPSVSPCITQPPWATESVSSWSLALGWLVSSPFFQDSF